MKLARGLILSFGILLMGVASSASDSVVIPNFHQVTEQIFRGGRPTGDDLFLLRERGFRTVIDLEHKNDIIHQERATARRLGMSFYSSPMSSKIRPSDQQINGLLSILQDRRNYPIFIHCHHGQDRTGLVVGLFRVEIQKWSAMKAYKEMVDLGFRQERRSLDEYFRDRTGLQGISVGAVGR